MGQEGPKSLKNGFKVKFSRFSQKSDPFELKYAVNFCVWSDIPRSKKFTWSFLLGVVKYVWPWLKWYQIVSFFNPKNELSYKVGFLNLVVIFLGVVKYIWPWLKWYQIVSFFNLKNELCYKVGFLNLVSHQQKFQIYSVI